MIEVAPDVGCMIYLGAAIFTIMGIWLRYHLRSKKKEVLSFPIAQKQCEFCHFTYLDDAAKQISRCPQCRFLNEGASKKAQATNRTGDSSEY
jgi:ribosomal protein L37AE/L43A